jgi:hypothetical protein
MKHRSAPPRRRRPERTTRKHKGNEYVRLSASRLAAERRLSSHRLDGWFGADIAGSFFSAGPEALLLNGPPGIGFIEAHGLAFIVGVMLWRADGARTWHAAAAAVHVLLGTANLLFWEFFVLSGTLIFGYVTTILHGSFVFAHLVALSGIRREAPAH